MKRICAWCMPPRFLGHVPPYDDDRETHGICPECAKKELQLLRAERKGYAMRELDIKEIATIRSMFIDRVCFLRPKEAMQALLALDETLNTYNALAAASQEGGIYSAPTAAGR